MRDPRNAAPAQIESPNDTPPITHTSYMQIKLPTHLASRGNTVNTHITKHAFTTLTPKPKCTQDKTHKGGARRDIRVYRKSDPPPYDNSLSLCSRKPDAQRGTTPQENYISNTKHTDDTRGPDPEGAGQCGLRFTELTASHPPDHIIALCPLSTYTTQVTILQGNGEILH